MAVVVKQGIWPNATFPWSGVNAGDFWPSIVAEIDGWITAISGNASIVANGMVPVKKRDYSSSTNGGTTMGFAYEFPDTSIGLNADGPTYPTLLVYVTETGSGQGGFGDKYEDNTGNNGYGQLSTTPGHRSTRSITVDVGYDRQAIIAYDTTDGQEFLSIGLKLGAADGDTTSFLVAKDMDGRWLFGVKDIGFVYDNVLGFWTGEIGPYDTDPVLFESSNSLRPYRIYPVGTTGASNRPGYDYEIQGAWYTKNPALYSGLSVSASYGDYIFVNGGTETITVLGYQGHSVRIPV